MDRSRVRTGVMFVDKAMVSTMVRLKGKGWSQDLGQV